MRIKLIVLFTCLCVATWSAAAYAGDWSGQEVEKDGIKHVMNPAKPAHGEKTVGLGELWRIGGDTDDEDEFFGVIGQIMTDGDGNVYLMDTQLNTVKVFSANGEFLREIGREGEGPGEFRFPTSMFLTGDGHVAVLQVQPGKIVLLTKDGEPAGEHALPESEGGLILVGGQSRGNNLVLAAAQNAFSPDKFAQTRYLCAIDDAGKETARYVETERSIVFSAAVLEDKMWDTFDRRWQVGTDGRVYAAPSYDNYEIHVWKSDGTPERIIEREYTHRERSADEKRISEEIMGIFSAQIPNCTVKIAENTKDIETFYIRDDGSIWVLTSDGARDHPDGTIGFFDVFDADGRFMTQVTLKGEGDPQLDGYYFVGDRLYVVTDLVSAAISLQAQGAAIQLGDEEPEPMSVIAYELDGTFHTSSR
jgi:hypothetical protein